MSKKASSCKTVKFILCSIGIFLGLAIFYATSAVVIWLYNSFLYSRFPGYSQMYSWVMGIIEARDKQEKQHLSEKAIKAENAGDDVRYKNTCKTGLSGSSNVDGEIVDEGKAQIVGPDSKLICVLQNVGFLDLKKVDFDIAVVDPDDSGLTSANLEYFIKGNRIVLAYLSIGEAENYRSYWDKDWKVGNPEFIDEPNPEWEGNFKVKFWHGSWHDIVLTQLQKIINLGYSGVYLDLVDAYSFYEQKGFSSAREEMINLVVKISDYAKRQNKNFLVVPQNAEELVEDNRYLSAIDGIGKENLWFRGDEPQSEWEVCDSLYYLSKVKMAKKFVLLISYVSREENIKDFLMLARSNGFIPYIGKRELNTIETYELD